MIPYEDLVVALNNWRTKQGLPVASGSVPVTSSGAGSGRTEAPVAAAEPVYEAAEESLEVGDELVEEQEAAGYSDGYAQQSGGYAQQSGGYGQIETPGDDATSIGHAPQRGDYDENPTELASESGQLRNQREDW